MAWFTDPVLYNEMIKKKRQGVIIEIFKENEQKSSLS